MEHLNVQHQVKGKTKGLKRIPLIGVGSRHEEEDAGKDEQLASGVLR